MSKNFSKTDTQKQAVAAATRALSSRKIQEVHYSASNSPVAHGIEKKISTLHTLWKENDLNGNRGLQDSEAVYARFHTDEQPPVFRLPEQTALYHNLMRVRCEALGIRHWGGIGHNIAALYADEPIKNDDNDIVSPVTALARHHLCGLSLRETATDYLPADAWKNLADTLSKQSDYSNKLINIINELFDEIKQSNKEDEQLNSTQKTAEKPQKAPPDDSSESEQETANDDIGQPEQDQHHSDMADTDTDTGETVIPESMPVPSYAVYDDIYQHSLAQYRIYTCRHDETIAADKLAEPFELKRLRAMLDKQTADMRKTIARLSNRLGRKLLSQQRQSWQFNQEEGFLDTARLFRIVTDPMRGLAFKRESNNPFKNTIVTILIDNSGSMRGRPIMTAACTADILSQALENAGIKTEILGFTTRGWKGGQARKQWEKNGSPHGVGRLNDIRHIIYKPADTPTRRVRNNLALMLKEGILKENIDGEALLWAFDRLMLRNENRRILMVISDGAPVDDATLGANGKNYLEDHLHQAIYWIEHKKAVNLVAIGIGHDVTRYYKNSIVIKDVAELGETLTQKLEELFSTKQ